MNSKLEKEITRKVDGTSLVFLAIIFIALFMIMTALVSVYFQR